MIELRDDQNNLVRFITAAEVSDYLGPDVVPDMLRDWRRRGLINNYRDGNKTYYRLDEVKSVEGVLRRGGKGRPRRTA